MGYRRFAVFFSIFLTLFVMFNFVVWKLRTEVILTKKYDGGDLSRLGYLPNAKEYRKKSDDLPARHLEMKDFIGQPVDILTIGDSYSNGGGEGRNSYYQDYIASISGLTVLNVYPYQTGDLIMGFSPVSTLAMLYNSGYLDLINPKCIVLQSVERYSIARFSRTLQFDATDSLTNIRSFYKAKEISTDPLPKVSFINEGNFKYLYYNFMYLFSDNAFRRLVYMKRLSRPVFNVGDGKTLLFHGDELHSVSLATPDYLRNLNNNLNHLSDFLGRSGIKLYFMPIVDKSNLYGDFMVDNHYPRSTFFEKLRLLPHRYTLIDTKEILLERVKQGDRDLFHSDDTHWTWRASKAVIEKVSFTDCCSRTGELPTFSSVPSSRGPHDPKTHVR